MAREPIRKGIGATMLEKQRAKQNQLREEFQRNGRRIDVYGGLIGLYEKSEFRRVQDLAQRVIQDLMQELASQELSSEEGRLKAIAMQSEIRAMTWFGKGLDHLRAEVKDRLNRRDRLKEEIDSLERLTGEDK